MECEPIVDLLVQGVMGGVGLVAPLFVWMGLELRKSWEIRTQLLREAAEREREILAKVMARTEQKPRLED